MRGYHFDEFTKSLHPQWWTYASGDITSIGSLADGSYRVRIPAGGSGNGSWFWLEQGHWQTYPEWPAPDLVMIPDDFYAKFTFPTIALPQVASGFNTQLWVYDTPAFDFWFGGLGGWFLWENYDYGWQWYFGGWADWDEYGGGWYPHEIPIGNPSEGWIRLKTPPGEFSQIFYSLTEPKFESDWIEFVGIPPDDPAGNGYIKPTGTGGEICLHVQGGGAVEALAEDADWFFDYVRPWVDNSLHRQMTADLDDIFYNVEEAAEEIIYEPRGEAAVGIRAVILGQQDDVITEPGILGDTMAIRVRSRDIPTPGRDSLILYGQRWFVLRNVGGGPHIGEWELEISKSAKRVLA